MTRTPRALPVLTLLLVALYMGQLYAHVLEIGPTLQYPPELSLRLHTSLYTWYGPPLGAALAAGTLITTGALSWLMRRQPTTRWLTGSALALQLAALLTYFARVEPINVRFHALSPGQVPSDFLALPAQGNHGHTPGFTLFVAVFLLLVIALINPSTHSHTNEQPGQKAENNR